MMCQGSLLASTGKAPSAVQMITLGIAAWRSTGSTLWRFPFYLSHLAGAHAELGLFDDAWRAHGPAMDGGHNNQGKLVRSRGPSHCW